MRRVDQAGGFRVRALSEYATLISTPAGTEGVKLIQLIMTRPVSGSTSMRSLSASSIAFPFPSTRPLGLVAGVTSYGPVQVWPQSIERCREIVCARPAPNFFTIKDE